MRLLWWWDVFFVLTTPSLLPWLRARGAPARLRAESHEPQVSPAASVQMQCKRAARSQLWLQLGS